MFPEGTISDSRESEETQREREKSRRLSVVGLLPQRPPVFARWWPLATSKTCFYSSAVSSRCWFAASKPSRFRATVTCNRKKPENRWTMQNAGVG